MKQFIVAIFLCFAFCALVNAAERKIAYDRGGKGKRGVDLSNVTGQQKPEVARETRANTDGERAVGVLTNTAADVPAASGPSLVAKSSAGPDGR
jgi:hypothetical protein